jgi:hypothetical protein
VAAGDKGEWPAGYCDRRPGYATGTGFM